MDSWSQYVVCRMWRPWGKGVVKGDWLLVIAISPPLVALFLGWVLPGMKVLFPLRGFSAKFGSFSMRLTLDLVKVGGNGEFSHFSKIQNKICSQVGHFPHVSCGIFHN